MEKLAVSCNTPELYEEVQMKAWGRVDFRMWSSYGKNSCLNITGNHWDTTSFYENSGYKVLTAAEYLGGKDVKEFEVGDRVEVNSEASSNVGKKGVVYKLIDDGDRVEIKLDEGHFPIYYQYKLNKLNDKPKTTKENNMNISDNILEVFTTSKDAKKVANRFGDQYGNSERDLLALKRDAKDLLAIIKDEEDEAKEVKKSAKK